MFFALDAACLGIFSASLAGRRVLGIENTGQVLFGGGSAAMADRAGALIARATAFLATCARGLIDVRGETGCDARLRCGDGLGAVLGS